MQFAALYNLTRILDDCTKILDIQKLSVRGNQ